MINKKLLSILIIMAIFIILPTSFADDNADINQTDVLCNEITTDTLQISDDNDVISSAEVYIDSVKGKSTATGTKDDPVKTIDEGLKIVSNGGTLYLSGTFRGAGNSNLTLDSTPADINFIGLNNAKIDGASSSYFLDVNTGSYSFKDLTFTKHYRNGDSEVFGGAIHNTKGSLTFTGCTFENNIVRGVNRANGGAIDSSGTVTVTNCKFTNNFADVTNSSGFRKNAADGGAISNLGELYIYNSVFYQNKALRNGGAIRAQDGATLYITNSQFIENVAEGHESGGSFGGAIYTWDCGMDLYNSTFKSNRVNDVSGYSGQGGAISSSRGSGLINVQSCQFINNTVKGVASANGNSIFIDSVDANINYCIIDTGIFSYSQTSNFDYNWWVVNGSDIKPLIENLPKSASVKTYAELKVTSDAEKLEYGKMITITAKLVWNGTDKQTNIASIPIDEIELSSNCGLPSGKVKLQNSAYTTTFKLTNIIDPIITTKIGSVVNNLDLSALDNSTRLSVIGEGNILRIAMNNNASGLCLIDVGDNKYYAVLEKSRANIDLSNLESGTYNVLVRYQGDAANNPMNATTPITVKSKWNSRENVKIIVAAKISKNAVDSAAGEKGTPLTVILKDSNNKALDDKNLQVALNGKIYNLKTDKNGQININVDSLSSGTYNCAVSFTGDDTYNVAPLTSVQLTIAKKATKITAKSKTFKVKSSKKIKVTLKTSKSQKDGKTYLKKGKKLTLSVNGRSYTSKINAKGVCKFTIKLTKKGTYTANIKFNGDSIYKASKKSIKIKIK